MISFMKPDKTVINRVIYYSNLIRESRLALFQLRKTMLAIRGLKFTIPSFNDLKDVEIELIRRIEEINNSSRLLLEPLFEGIDFGHKFLNNWTLSTTEIEQGYCELEEIKQYNNGRPYIYGRKYILLLRDYTDATFGTFYAGELIEFVKADHFISNIPIIKDTKRGLYNAIIGSIKLALRSNVHKSITNE